MLRTLICAGLAVIAPVTFGQPAEGKLAFEVASVKPAAPVTGIAAIMFRMRGGPGTADPGQITYTNMSLQRLLIVAYDLKREYRLSGPGWMDNEKFDIVAKVPEGATREQVNVMIQNLLAERFGLIAHHETRDIAGYEMVVAKSGPKLKESPGGPSAAAEAVGGGPPRVTTQKDKDGLTELPPGTTGGLTIPVRNGMRYSARNQALSQLTGHLENPLGRPVVDKTGLTGKYDFNLTYGRDQRTMANVITDGQPPAPATDDSSDGPPDLFTAMQEQLGLKLESKKVPIDVMVIDRLEKAPTAN